MGGMKMEWFTDDFLDSLPEGAECALLSICDQFAAMEEYAGEAGVVLGKLGDDAKPFVDRVREITEVVWRCQARSEQLPGDVPLRLLPGGDEETDT